MAADTFADWVDKGYIAKTSSSAKAEDAGVSSSAASPRSSSSPAAAHPGAPVGTDRLPGRPDGLTCIDLDFRRAGEVCVEYLATLGHRRVALIGSPPEVYFRGTAFARLVAAGFTAAADRNGLRSTVHPCVDTPVAARAMADRLVREHPDLTGIVVHNEPVLCPGGHRPAGPLHPACHGCRPTASAGAGRGKLTAGRGAERPSTGAGGLPAGRVPRHGAAPGVPRRPVRVTWRVSYGGGARRHPRQSAANGPYLHR